jgi:hypothetical protein
MNAIRDNNRSLRRDQLVSQQFVTRSIAYADHARRLAKTTHDASGHAPEQKRAALRLVLKETPESIHIMTGDNGSLSREFVNQMSVAVIYNVKEIELRATAAKEARVIQEAVEQAVGFEPCTILKTALRKTTMHQRGETRRVNYSGMFLLQVLEQHVRDQIHARPILFPVITNDCEARQTH